MRILILGLVIGAFLLQGMAILPLGDSVLWMIACGLAVLLAFALGMRNSVFAQGALLVLMLAAGMMLVFWLRTLARRTKDSS